MSAAPEVVAANRIGLPVAVAALVTNPGTGIAPSVLSHAEVLDVGRRSAGQVGTVIRQLLVEL
jgi:purine-nucleoside phosphorylase